jgi:hypothetical protein
MKWRPLFFLFFFCPFVDASIDLQGLYSIAQNNLRSNIVETTEGNFLRAGANHYGALWTRDFCYSIPGLLAMGRSDVVRDHLTLLIKKRQTSTHLIPRLLINQTSTNKMLGHLPPILRSPPLPRPPFKAVYLNEHKTIEINSNILVLRGALLYLEATGDQFWWHRHKKAFNQIFQFYHNKFTNGLIIQDKFADWQNSVERSGATFLTNFLYWSVTDQLKRFPSFKIKTEENMVFKKLLKKTFMDKSTGLFKSHMDLNIISLEGNLFALESPSFLENSEIKESFYTALKKHPLWIKNTIPGMVSFPDYPSHWRGLRAKITGLNHYHDRLAWSWLMAFSTKMTLLLNDGEEALRLLKKINQIVQRDGVIGEIYSPKNNFRLFKGLLYSSEAPFSWGAAYMVEMLSYLEKDPN